ncbi:hypothetical protein BG011_003411 [Mortierella polycephala]|uniref:Nucleoporin Pom152 n=1 Tax=Mortierella polycephala TaxID=41804 RepID=A0A9P6Q537_9FUNG|nr:hypothetical protein BG011_003411 [Mortierella polycephala]
MATPVPLKSSGTRPQNAFPSNARIPLEYCDGPTQRMYAVSVFVFLQALKLYYWLGIARSDYAAEFFGFILWLTLDVAFLMALNYLRIPWLEMPVIRLTVAIFLLAIINFVLFTVREVSPSAIARSSASKVWGYVRTPSSSARDSKFRNQDEHLLGRHTVLIKPYSTAILNPEDQCFCVPDVSLPIIGQPEIPIIFNGSEPHYMEYSITSFETGLTAMYKLSGPFRESSAVLHKARSSREDGKTVYNLRANSAGAYKLHKIQDKDGVDVRFYHDREAFVVNCPEARIDDYKDTLERCSGKGDVEVPIIVRGLPPWTVTYRRHSLKKETQELLIESEPIGYSSPLLKGWSPPATPNYSWAKQHEMNLSVSLGLATPGEYSFQVTRVKDGCGNVIDVQTLVARNLREAEIRHVNVRERPSVTMVCDPRKPIKIVNMGDSPTADIGLEIKRGTAPYNVGYVYQKSDLDEPQAMKDIEVLEGNRTPHITAQLPGLYTLSHINDAFCEGEIGLPRDCSITVASHPTVDVISHPINDSCVGAIGVTVDATFTGEGPWTVCFEVWRNGRLMSRNVCHDSRKPRLNVELKPDLSGNFQYIFTTVSDKNYRNIKVDLPPIFQNIHPQPSASFVGDRTGIKTCRGSTKTLDVELFGTGPWDIEYRVIRGADIQLFTERNISQKMTTLTLPPFEREGIYSVDLGRVTDLANGCQKDLKVSDVAIEVSNGPPTASFQCDVPVEFAEGDSVDLPVHLTGGTPWYLTYGIEGENSLNAARSESRNALVSVNKPGIYELKSVSDAFCDGEVVEQARTCTVVYSERPSMNLMIDSIRFRGGPRENVPEGEIAPSERISREGDYFVLPAVCKDADRTLELRMTGKAPFELRYKRIYRSARGAKEEVKTLVEMSQHSTMRLPIMTEQAGTISYQFETLSDATYKNIEVRHEKRIVVFKHLVRSPPRATLINTEKQFYCKNEITGANEKIAIKIEDGVGPYTLAIEIMRPYQAVAEKLYAHDVVPRNGVYEWTLSARFTDMGLYKVSILRVTDINGCSAGGTSAVEFDVLDTPSITPLRSITDTCVGDKLEYSIQGEAPPFMVYYSLDETNHSAKLDEKRRLFSYETTKPGLFKISKVCQTLAKKQCCTQSLEGMSTRIWAIPTVKVADGSNLITDLREGDRAEVVATFIGEAPFSWSYVQTEAAYDIDHHAKHGKRPNILDKRTVKDIQGNKYTFFTATEGTIVPTWIKDKHCQFGKEM